VEQNQGALRLTVESIETLLAAHRSGPEAAHTGHHVPLAMVER
jgi:hypothetical protein